MPAGRQRLHIKIVAVGQRMPGWAESAVADYLKRLPAEIKVEICAVKAEPRGNDSRKPAALRALLSRESQRIRAQLPPRCTLVVLDERGEDLTTLALAQRLEAWQVQAAPVAVVIGGPDGIDAQLRAEARQAIRLSSLTLPHALVRVLLAEQLYRAWSVNAQHPYHRD
jgi:23S rRNA (pseudouridine1915-N3)-methyltransferase